MNNDLISREALKEALGKSTVTIIGYGEAILLDTANELINNAPTVEPFEPDYVGAERLKARQRGYADGYHNGMEIGKTLNPKIKQGEWIIDGHHRRCNYCNEYTCTEDREGNSIPDNFCPFCGAEMQKGGAE